jgi:hypothetical protein
MALDVSRTLQKALIELRKGEGEARHSDRGDRASDAEAKGPEGHECS